jgi:ABC-type sulfate transport system substrate-binding protein
VVSPLPRIGLDAIVFDAAFAARIHAEQVIRARAGALLPCMLLAGVAAAPLVGPGGAVTAAEVSYDVGARVLQGLQPLGFIKQLEGDGQRDVVVNQSHGGSSKQARSVDRRARRPTSSR